MQFAQPAWPPLAKAPAYRDQPPEDFYTGKSSEKWGFNRKNLYVHSCENIIISFIHSYNIYICVCIYIYIHMYKYIYIILYNYELIASDRCERNSLFGHGGCGGGAERASKRSFWSSPFRPSWELPSCSIFFQNRAFGRRRQVCVYP